MSSQFISDAPCAGLTLAEKKLTPALAGNTIARARFEQDERPMYEQDMHRESADQYPLVTMPNETGDNCGSIGPPRL